MTTATADRAEHQRFLDRYYGWARAIYDVTRKYYLFGRDVAIRQLLEEPWVRLIEIGPGTGRNLAMLRKGRRDGMYGGIEASRAMLEVVHDKCPWAVVKEGFAEDAQYSDLLGAPPDRILISYTLSMVQDADAALTNARRQLAPGGEVVVVDFSDLKGLRGPLGPLLRRWLEAFHVHPVDVAILRKHARKIEEGPFGYYRIARMDPLRD